MATPPGRRTQAARVSAALLGAAVEYAARNLSVRARTYCGAGFEAGGALEMTFLPLVVGAGILLGATTCAAALHLTRNAPAPQHSW